MKMRIDVYKAQPTIKTDIVETVRIYINEPIPEAITLKDAELTYKAEAKKIAFGLTSSLPQGTMHQLLIILLQQYPNYFIYPMPKEKE
jgi:hypothetical protein